ncbi:hypothetical protein [Actinomadura litoris]|uniref:Uncharacterized protein n=1 Tax=Actinomadura litoris TaxID=2678616 RepID=A0A7K1KYM3_9ACTN|nr:hypothetical protein [Actinomadura litoris]MUN37147.1 hypothetical protein [Actinomadura litoris]
MIGPDPGWWGTPGERRTVLIVTGSPIPARPLLDVARLADADPRLRVVFTAAPEAAGSGTESRLRDAGAVVLPWREARDREFGLAVAATAAPDLAPRVPLVVLPDARRACAPGDLRADGRRRPVLALAHRDERTPPSREGPAEVVVGDPIHDRLVASLPLRDFYRRVLGAGGDRRLVVVAIPAGDAACRAGPCRPLDVVRRLLAELPSERYHVLGVPEREGDPCPGGRALAGPLRDGLALLPPGADWRAALAAADWIVGEAGPLTRYGAVTGAPVVLVGSGDVRGPGMAELARLAPRLDARGRIEDQLGDAAAYWRPDRARPVIERITSEPGRFHRNTRRLMYGLLRLPQPATIPVADPVSPPFHVGCTAEDLRDARQGG